MQNSGSRRFGFKTNEAGWFRHCGPGHPETIGEANERETPEGTYNHS
jgi:hypothetical protein